MPKITGLPADSSLALTDLVPVVSDGDTKKVELSTIASTVRSTVLAGWDGWQSLSGILSVATGYNAGNKSFTIDSTVDQSAIVSPGNRFKIVRGTSPPTQCTDLESGSSQYASKSSPSGISFTDDFVQEAWIKQESYPATGQVMQVCGRTDGTSGFMLWIDEYGRVISNGRNAAAANFSRVISNQSIPLGKWIHVAVQLDMSSFTVTSSTSFVLIDGMDVLCTVLRGGTNPTAILQAGNYEIGRGDGSTFYYDGKVADVRLWSAKRTYTQIRDNMNQQLVGNETNLVGYWKLNGNFNDSTSNANNLTAGGSAVATNVDNPMNSTEYGIITKVTSTQITVFTGQSYNIPNLTLSTPYFSSQDSPFGFPTDTGKWIVSALYQASYSAAGTALTWANVGSVSLSIPLGAWKVNYQNFAQVTHAGATFLYALNTLSTSTTALSDQRLTTRTPEISASITQIDAIVSRYGIPITLTAATPYYLLTAPSHSSTTVYVGASTTMTTEVFAECAYI